MVEQTPAPSTQSTANWHAVDYFGINTHALLPAPICFPTSFSGAGLGVAPVLRGLCRGCSVCIRGSNTHYKSLVEISTAQLLQHAEWPPLINKPSQPPTGRVALSLPHPKLVGVNMTQGSWVLASRKGFATRKLGREHSVRSCCCAAEGVAEGKVNLGPC